MALVLCTLGTHRILRRGGGRPPSRSASVLRQTNLRGGGRQADKDRASRCPFYLLTRAATATTTLAKSRPPPRTGSHSPRSDPPFVAPSSTWTIRCTVSPAFISRPLLRRAIVSSVLIDRGDNYPDA